MMHGFGFMGFGWIIWLLIIIIAGWFLINNFSQFKRQGNSEPSALEILKSRYAKGEISKEDFERMRDELN